jgi:hypothetical protein
MVPGLMNVQKNINYRLLYSMSYNLSAKTMLEIYYLDTSINIS